MSLSVCTGLTAYKTDTSTLCNVCIVRNTAHGTYLCVSVGLVYACVQASESTGDIISMDSLPLSDVVTRTLLDHVSQLLQQRRDAIAVRLPALYRCRFFASRICCNFLFMTSR